MPTRRQAKGRVARANQTRQDRLVKALRRHGISAIDSAKAFLPEFIADYSRRVGGHDHSGRRDGVSAGSPCG